jgi:DNA-binding winged helix-turn-helix (wHTH) protein
MAGETFRFEEYELDVAGHQLRRGGEPVHVEPRAFDLLCHLVAHRDRVVSKNELLDEVWGDRFVSEAALTTALRTARLAIGDIVHINVSIIAKAINLRKTWLTSKNWYQVLRCITPT